MTKSIPYIIAILSVFAAFFYNELNIKALRSGAPERLELKYNTIKTPDDASYLRPAENYYHTGVWRDNSPGHQSYFLREPGYGIFRYVLMKISGIEHSHTYFKYVQLLLFGISVFFLFQVASLAGLPLRYALIIEGIYGLSPFASGFLYYSITEAITPTLMILYVYFLLSGYKKAKPVYFLMASLVLGYIGITRPVLLLFGAALPLAVYWSVPHLSFSRKVLFVTLTVIIALAPIGTWALRSARIAGSYVGLHPIYYIESNSQFRPTHRAIWEFDRSLGMEQIDFNRLMVPLWLDSMEGDASEKHIDTILMAYPAFVKQTIGKERLRRSYDLYMQSLSYQRSHYPANVPMPDTILATEQQVINDFDTYTSEINSKQWLRCHLVVPFKLFKTMSFHSNLSLYMFQHTYRGCWWMEALRGVFLILHCLCCLSFLAILLLKGDKLTRVLFGITIGVYFFYLCYVFRGLEERYTLPILPFMLLSLAYSIYVLSKRTSTSH